MNRSGFLVSASSVFVTGCAGGAGKLLAPPSPQDHLYDLMRQQNIARFRDLNGRAVVLPEYQTISDPRFSTIRAPRLQPQESCPLDGVRGRITPQDDSCGGGGGGGGGGGLPIIATVTVWAGDVAVGYDYSAGFYDVATTYTPAASTSAYYGPIYGSRSPIPHNCVAYVVGAALSGAATILNYLKNSGTINKFGATAAADVSNWIRAGMTAAAAIEAMAILTAVLSSETLLTIAGAALAAAGTIWAIYQYLACQNGW